MCILFFVDSAPTQARSSLVNNKSSRTKTRERTFEFLVKDGEIQKKKKEPADNDWFSRSNWFSPFLARVTLIPPQISAGAGRSFQIFPRNKRELGVAEGTAGERKRETDGFYPWKSSDSSSLLLSLILRWFSRMTRVVVTVTVTVVVVSSSFLSFFFLLFFFYSNRLIVFVYTFFFAILRSKHSRDEFYIRHVYYCV